MANTNAELAESAIVTASDDQGDGDLVFDIDILRANVEAALSTAESNLAREVLADVNAANIVPHPATDYQQGLVDGVNGVEKRLRKLFTRLNVRIAGG